MTALPKKSIWESKTIYVALAQGLLGVLTVISTEHPGLGWALVSKSFLDVLLRVLTDKGVMLWGQ